MVQFFFVAKYSFLVVSRCEKLCCFFFKLGCSFWLGELTSKDYIIWIINAYTRCTILPNFEVGIHNNNLCAFRNNFICILKSDRLNQVVKTDRGNVAITIFNERVRGRHCFRSSA